MHPRRIERIASLLMALAEERQIVVSSHSPVLVDAILRARRESENPDRIGLFNVRCGDEGTVVEPTDWDCLRAWIPEYGLQSECLTLGASTRLSRAPSG